MVGTIPTMGNTGLNKTNTKPCTYWIGVNYLICQMVINAIGKAARKRKRKCQSWREDDFQLLEILTKKVTFEQRSQGREQATRVSGDSVSGKGNTQCKEPEAGLCLECWRDSKPQCG